MALEVRIESTKSLEITTLFHSPWPCKTTEVFILSLNFTHLQEFCTSSKSDIMERLPDSGISVLVVGAGIAGLAFSIEAYRQGHINVKILEKRAAPGDYGKYRKCWAAETLSSMD